MVQSYAHIGLWLAMIPGIIIGLIVGILPGMGSMVALALVLPFVFMMPPELALILMTAVLSVRYQGGAITAILINVPGETASSATIIDGFPMTQKGEGGRALGAALGGCGLGKVVSSLLTLAMVPLVLPLIMALRSADMVFVILLGIACISLLASGSMVKGLISGGAGLLLSFIGYQISSGVERFTFGSPYLYDGLSLIAVALGVFALPEMIDLATMGGTIAQAGARLKGMADVWQGLKDCVRHWGLIVRSSTIGFILGVLPGIGATPAAFIAYGQAKQTSKHPETFGTGNVEGVIAPECANDAEGPGALLTTLALGIPGNAPMALVLTVFLIMGIRPGPEMLTKHLDLSLTLISIGIVASTIGIAICLLLASQLSKVAFIPGRILAPLILVIVFSGAFVFQQLTFDIGVLLVFGVIGFVMKRYGWNRPALLLGLIMGNLFEKYFFLAYKLAGPFFFLRPISLGLILVIIAIIAYQPIASVLKRRRGVSKA